MIEIVKIDSITPAPYNPRRIQDGQFDRLKRSLTELGFTVPILVNSKNNIIIAGHQRTKAARAIGMTEVPAIKIDKVAYGDEIKFNQLHNGVDAQRGFECTVDGQGLTAGEFISIDIDRFKVKNFGAIYVKEICGLLLKYGNVFSCVICGGEVVVGVNYIRACQLLGLMPTCYIVDDSKRGPALHYLRADYGEYSYDGIQRNTYVQGLAQLHRSREIKIGRKKANKSSLYENYVIPYINTHKVVRVLDFGCGKAEYINHLKSFIDTAIGVEFYNNNGHQIDVSAGNRQIDALIKQLSISPIFDVVVCDSVLNSVDSVEAERSVMACLNLFCGERLFISGRPLCNAKAKLRQEKDKSNKRYITYLDGNNFTGDYRKGNWYFQHYHDKNDVEKLMAESGFEIKRMTYGTYGDSFQVEAVKVSELARQQYIDAIDFEFNLPLPNGKSYNRHNEVKAVLGFN